MPQIHWTAPALLIGSLIAGILFALGHHLFYASLDRKPAPTSLDGYDVLGMHVSIQQFNTAVGTAFAFLVRTFLMLSISTAYFQMLIWNVRTQGTKGTQLGHLDVMTSALQDLRSLARVGTWWRRPWLWLLALVAWLIPIASIVTPATLSVGISVPDPIRINVPNVAFSSLNLAAPMAEYGISGGANLSGLNYVYGGPSLTVQRIADAVAAQGSILPVKAPAVNSSWTLDFDGPSLRCKPVGADVRVPILDNILNYTYERQAGGMSPDCGYGPGFVAWHPSWATPDSSTNDLLPFIISNLNSSEDPLNNNDMYGYPYADVASIFIAIAPTLFSSVSTKGSWRPTMCKEESWYKAGLATYYNTSTVLKCDMHNATYQTNFSFVDGIQKVDISNVTDVTNTPMDTLGMVLAYFDSFNQTIVNSNPRPCPPSNSTTEKCLYDPLVMSTISYQAIMHAFTKLVAGTISLGDREDLDVMVTSTTRLSSTVLAEAPELAFLQNMKSQTQDEGTPPPVQQEAITWQQKPFAGLVNTAAAANSALPFQQALEQLFQNITLSLMSAPDLQPNSSSTYYPEQTEVRLETRDNIYIYAAQKLWLAYGLAVGATTLIALFGLATVIANGASFSNKFSTMLRLSRGAQLSHEINHVDLSGRDPLPTYAEDATVTFSQEGMLGRGDSTAYKLVDREGKDDDSETAVRQRNTQPL